MRLISVGAYPGFCSLILPWIGWDAGPSQATFPAALLNNTEEQILVTWRQVPPTPDSVILAPIPSLLPDFRKGNIRSK